MKQLFFFISSISLIWLLSACNHENNTSPSSGSATTDAWAEQVESNTALMKPDSWADEDWKKVNKNVAKEKIFSTIINAVTSGKQKAYDFFTDSAYTVDEVKARLENIKAENISAIRTRETWNFDNEKFRLEKQVKSICLFIPKISEEGEYIGDKALFYVKLNN